MGALGGSGRDRSTVGAACLHSHGRDQSETPLSYVRAKGENVLVGENETARGSAWIPETALDSRGLRRPAILCRLVWGCTDHVLARENEKRCLLS